jgi:hypothetical protein
MNETEVERQYEEYTTLSAAHLHYQDLWARVSSEWQESRSGCQVWLTYAANYLLNCDGFKFALDPFSMGSRVPGIQPVDYLNDLHSLTLVLLSHEHNDHLDRELIKTLHQAEVTWIIPSHLQAFLRDAASLPNARILTPQPGQRLTVGPLTIIPFDSLHLNGQNGVSETGYLLECRGKRWLFPGDIRNYDSTRLPDFGPLNVVFAHLWLGKGGALEDPPPLLNEFCDFFAHFDADRVVVSHLYEFGRDERDLWTESHYLQVKEGILKRKPAMKVDLALMGTRIDLYC